MSCLPIHRIYAFFIETASSPNSLCSSWDITFVVHFDSPHITFWILIIFLSSFFMAGREYGTA